MVHVEGKITIVYSIGEDESQRLRDQITTIADKYEGLQILQEQACILRDDFKDKKITE